MDTYGPDFGQVPFNFFDLWLLEPDLVVVVNDRWVNSGKDQEVFSKIEKLSRMFRMLKVRLKNWTKLANLDKDKEKVIVTPQVSFLVI